MNQIIPSTYKRRVGPRRALRSALVLMLPGNKLLKGEAWDLGEDGVGLVCSKPVSPGTACRVTLDLPYEGQSITVKAAVKIVYSSYLGPERFKLGAVFSQLDEESSRLIREFVSSG